MRLDHLLSKRKAKRFAFRLEFEPLVQTSMAKTSVSIETESNDKVSAMVLLWCMPEGTDCYNKSPWSRKTQVHRAIFTTLSVILFPSFPNLFLYTFERLLLPTPNALCGTEYQVESHLSNGPVAQLVRALL